MRPGQTAPECGDGDDPQSGGRFGFNEAGADCPGMPVTLQLCPSSKVVASMRPGQTAPECDVSPESDVIAELGFNEAGADCPGMPIPISATALQTALASMRPGQTAPECLFTKCRASAQSCWLQ